MKYFKLKINDIDISVPAGTTILNAACEAGIYIPGLCAHPDLPPVSQCGLCAVEIKGQSEIMLACETKAENDMVIYTDLPGLQSIRKKRLSKILANHPHACLTCAQRNGCNLTQCSNNVPENERCCPLLGNCELQKVADYIGIPTDTPKYVHKNFPVNHEFLIVRDPNLCIGCSRCIRACDNLRGIGALKLVEREGRHIALPVSGTLAQSGCRFCTACIEVCPTRALKDLNAKHDKDPVPCRSNCPAHIDVPGYIRAIQKGNFKEAVAKIMEKAPFPATLGRVCFHPCEVACRRGDINEPVSICHLNRFAAANEFYCPPPLKNTGKKVAVVGSGPAGLTAAYFLRLLGHDITVFETLKELGGMLRVGIPAYRLPREVLNREIDQIASLGVKMIPNVCIENPGLMLEQGFNAVFIATGANRSVSLEIPGENSPCVLQGINYLREVNLGRIMPLGDKVAIIGGGNVAVDVARTAIRLGTRSVTVFYRRTKNEMPAFREEVEQAEREGVAFEYLLSPKRIIAKTPLEVCFARMELGGSDSNGRKQPFEINGIEISRNFNSVVVAIGQLPSIPGFESMRPEEINRLHVDTETMSTVIPGIFVGGDVVTGPSSVIEAIAAGRRAADAISRYLEGDGLDQIFDVREKPCLRLEKIINFADLQRVKEVINERQIVNAGFSVDLLEANFNEINLGIGDGEQATLEASRCLQCDLRLHLRSPVMPPERLALLDESAVNKVLTVEGVYTLFDESKQVICIKGTANLRDDLLQELQTNTGAKYFDYKVEPRYTQREN